MRKKHQVYDYIANEIRCSYFSKKKKGEISFSSL